MSALEVMQSEGDEALGETKPGPGPIRVGLVLYGLPDEETPAFKYFILLLNRLQTTFEFEFYDAPEESRLAKRLRVRKAHDPENLRSLLPRFAKHLRHATKQVIDTADLADVWPSQIIVVSLATLSNAHFLIRRGNVSLLALGLWKRSMAPPSAAEIVQLLVLRAGYSALEGRVWNEIHAGTRACLFDYTDNLEDTRFMALSGVGVCSLCRQALIDDGHGDAPEEIRRIVERSWLGERDKPGTPAAIMASLGYDLYLTKGFSPTTTERVLQIVREEGVKELLKIVSGVLLAAALVIFGFKVKESAKVSSTAAVHADSQLSRVRSGVDSAARQQSIPAIRMP